MLTIERMTPEEFEIRMEAYRLQQVDQEFVLHRMAWLNREITAQKKAGKNKTKPYFDSFKKFFDYKRLEDEARGRETKRKPTSLGARMMEAIRIQEEKEKNG